MTGHEALRVAVLDLLGRFAPREAWEADPRVDDWTVRLAAAADTDRASLVDGR